METKQRLAQMRSERKAASTTARKRIECVEANVDFIDQLTDEFSWYAVGYGDGSYFIQASVHCDSDEAVKEACRLARSLLGCKSEKELDSNDGTMTYRHRKVGKEKNRWGDPIDIGNSIEVSGGRLTPGCKLIAETQWTEPRKYTTYKMDCGKE